MCVSHSRQTRLLLDMCFVWSFALPPPPFFSLLDSLCCCFRHWVNSSPPSVSVGVVLVPFGAAGHSAVSPKHIYIYIYIFLQMSSQALREGRLSGEAERGDREKRREMAKAHSAAPRTQLSRIYWSRLFSFFDAFDHSLYSHTTLLKTSCTRVPRALVGVSVRACLFVLESGPSYMPRRTRGSLPVLYCPPLLIALPTTLGLCSLFFLCVHLADAGAAAAVHARQGREEAEKERREVPTRKRKKERNPTHK